MAEAMFVVPAAFTLFTKLLASRPLLPIVKARMREIKKIPIA
jgi:hypothetical protein